MTMHSSLPALLLVAACTQQPANVAATDNGEVVVDEGNANSADTFANPSENAVLPDDRTPLEELNGAIDPKGAEAAGQVVQSFGALIEQSRWAEAEALWGNSAIAKRFIADVQRNRESHIEIGKPGEPEGAAGSVFVTMPIVLYGKNSAGADFRRGADVILRRVNDVEGSTEAQRRWHIERIELRA